MDLALLVFRRGSPHREEAIADPAGFLDRRRDALDAQAARHFSSRGLFPVSRCRWALILPDSDPMDLLPTLDGVHGREVAVTIGRQVARFPDAVIAWAPAWVVEKGWDSAEVREAS